MFKCSIYSVNTIIQETLVDWMSSGNSWLGKVYPNTFYYAVSKYNDKCTWDLWRVVSLSSTQILHRRFSQKYNDSG